MARVADDLVAVARHVAINRARPPALDGVSYHNHRTVVTWIPVLHCFEDTQDLIVVVGIFHREHIPAVCGPLVLNAITIVLGLNDAAYQLVINTCIIVRKQDS